MVTIMMMMMTKNENGDDVIMLKVMGEGGVFRSIYQFVCI